MKKISILLLLVLFIFEGNIYAQDPVCKKIYNEGLTLMNKKNKESYQDAIKKFVAAEECDKKLQDDCAKKISECKKAIEALSAPKPTGKPSSTSTPSTAKPPSPPATVRVSKDKIRIPEQGSVEDISVSGGDNNWTLSDDATWCVAERSGSSIIINCEPNKTTLSRTAIIEVKGSNNKITITVEQEAGKEQLSVIPEALTFPAEGTEGMVTVYSNTLWNVETALSWCHVEKEDNTITVKIDANDLAKERKGDITVKSKTLTRTISVSQDAGKEKQKVPRRVQVETKSSDDEENVETKTGVSTGSNRRSSVGDTSNRRSIPPDRDKSSRRGTYSDDNTPSGKIRTSPAGEDYYGRKISFGIMANALMPNFSVNASGFTGSAIDYGHGKNIEKPSYSSKTGFSGGLVADIRIANNIYVQTGLYYTNLGIKNTITGDYVYSEENYTSTTYLEGTGRDNITEEYTLNYLEIPVLFSYRIPFSAKTALQINAGPYIGYGLSAKGKIKGTREMLSLTEYFYEGDRPTGNVYEIKSTVSGEIDMFGKSGQISQVYSTGDQPTYNNNDKFKNAPLRNIDAGVSVGTVLEFAGINLGVYYDIGMMNMANETYWKSERMRLSLDEERTGMNNYVHKLNKLQIRIGYIYRW
ncbi:MAG: outer membrane beta-barrel protein [Tannerella sp.]|jgi:hypothetical protein|nr:outer membrane beta-barrel protein [Tannerella sp.]